jgi:hypothetical protein
MSKAATSLGPLSSLRNYGFWFGLPQNLALAAPKYQVCSPCTPSIGTNLVEHFYNFGFAYAPLLQRLRISYDFILGLTNLPSNH